MMCKFDTGYEVLPLCMFCRLSMCIFVAVFCMQFLYTVIVYLLCL